MRSIYPAILSSAAPRFLAGTLAEAEELFGRHLPQLPQAQDPEGRGPVLLVELHVGLKKAARDLVTFLYASLTDPRGSESGSGGDRRRAPDAYAHYAGLLSNILQNIIQNERRLGLLNLFWLAHTKEVAAVIQEFFGQSGVRGALKYQMYPLLRGVYRSVQTAVWQQFRQDQTERLRTNLGGDFNSRLIDSIFDDQLSLTESSVAQLNLTEVLVDQNKRFHLTYKEFREILALLRERFREGVARRESRLLELVRARFSGFSIDRLEDDRLVTRMLFQQPILHYLLLDYDGFVPRLTASPLLKPDRGDRRGWGGLVHDYLDLVEALKRTEVVDLLRQAVQLVAPGLDETQRRALFSEGHLYRFQEATEILNSSRKVTVLFADLRGFTRTSEGGISEGELTQHLYTVLDPLASIVQRHNGAIDKFTGDGAMITFGVQRFSRQDELNALRAALALQDLMAELRAAGATRFRMGISVHTGLAQVARFIVDDWITDTTVIGRNVNIAGRLSSSGRETGPGQEEGGGGPGPRAAGPGADVWVDKEGILYNLGIVVSQDTVEELGKAVALEPLSGGGGRGFTFYDEAVKKNLLLEYVGDAKFKGVVRAIAIYRLRRAP